MPDPYTQAFLTQAARGLQAPLWIGLASEEVGSRSGFCLPYRHPTFCLRAGCLCPSPRDASSASQLPPPSTPFLQLQPLCSSRLCRHFVSIPDRGGGRAAGASRAGRQSAHLHSPFPLLPDFFKPFPCSLSSFPLSLRLLRCARPALITPNHPPVFVSPGSQALGARACVCVCGGRGPLVPMRVLCP